MPAVRPESIREREGASASRWTDTRERGSPDCSLGVSGPRSGRGTSSSAEPRVRKSSAEQVARDASGTGGRSTASRRLQPQGRGNRLRGRQRDCAKESRLHGSQALSTQIVRNTGESNTSQNQKRPFTSPLPQRFPTVRSHGRLGNGESRAKTLHIRDCSSTVACKRPLTLMIPITPLLKSRVSRNEKVSLCNRNGAPSDEHS